MSPSASKGLGLWDVCETWTKKRTWSSSRHSFAELSWRSCHACWRNVGRGHRMLPSASDWLSGWSIGLEWEVCWWENVKTWKDSLNFRKTGEAALWVCWRGGSYYDGVGMYLLLLPLSSVCHYACLPHPSTFKGSWRGSELPAGRKQHALTGIAIWLSPEIKTFCLFTLSNILKVLITNSPWSLSSSAV